jgi:hypothetical protein
MQLKSNNTFQNQINISHEVSNQRKKNDLKKAKQLILEYQLMEKT